MNNGVNNNGDINSAIEAIREMRYRNADVFSTPTVDKTFNYIHEETGELWRYAERIGGSNHLRTNNLEHELDYGKHLELGQVLMMVFTAAIQLNIDGDKALAYAIAHTDNKCQRRRDERREEDEVSASS